MNGLSVSFSAPWKDSTSFGPSKGDSCAHLDLLRLASAAAAWRSWVDLLTGTPNTALWVTSLRMRLWPLFGAAFGEEGGVSEPALWLPRLLIYMQKILKGEAEEEYEEMSFWTTGRNKVKTAETETGKKGRLQNPLGQKICRRRRFWVSQKTQPERERLKWPESDNEELSFRAQFSTLTKKYNVKKIEEV